CSSGTSASSLTGRMMRSSTPLLSAMARSDSTAWVVISIRLIVSLESSATPASSREISSRSASRASKRSSSSTSSSVERDRPGGNSSREACSTSAAIRTVVSGVRSSWETSEVNRRCSCPNSSSWVICCLRLSAISLNDSASLATSSSTITDRKSTRLNSSHVKISYAVFCLKKKKKLHY